MAGGLGIRYCFTQPGALEISFRDSRLGALALFPHAGIKITGDFLVAGIGSKDIVKFSQPFRVY